ncbi:Histidine phosphatase superfamily (branch 1) [Candidatus Arcanobacter lacustris]|uniref:Histidine phosphatase superfamily (Branch 1) n=1 Tax=Candidatus Arcanibacter lacustris TaxID=1607817 RepID=A0A0F5MQL9_9RICK|nr:Histidine phosphatase superfamily (branch 1) [Candidatus Arcanobacter lacustris]
MKNIFIARHAKAEFNEEIDDQDRSLTSKGISDCKDLADSMKNHTIPQLIICSNAKRSHDTALNIISHLNKDIKLQVIDDLYLSSRDEIITMIESIDNQYTNVMIVGHNPSISQLVTACANNSDISKGDLMQLSVGMSPASAALFSFNQPFDWQNFRETKSSNKWFFKPL